MKKEKHRREGTAVNRKLSWRHKVDNLEEE